MDTVISFTPAQLWTGLVAFCAGLSALAAAIALVAKAINKLKAPNKQQDARLVELEEKTKKHEGLLDNDNKRLNALEKERGMEHRALLALLKHGIDNNNIEAMKASSKEIQDYLISK